VEEDKKIMVIMLMMILKFDLLYSYPGLQTKAELLEKYKKKTDQLLAFC
jgi:hypothetical protein